ncbi:Gfo/Idh/MocA family protein [Planctomycetes bacterium K23_9]|uniref:Oxidoreductase family, NAD-binding Rossmann fold n=1 Tax=Stieleria marina TaxID=1930275 RepID=A0A517NVG1_9BACT|nr:Oxidoreductase family, NAD-binding Rossmann fold [Planctomycetes bacterium K23_9]
MRFTLLLIVLCTSPCWAADDVNPGDSDTLRIGVIGLDTSHVTAFTKAFNTKPTAPEMQNCRVVAAYPYGSRDIESSSSRIPRYTEAMKTLGVEICDSIDALLGKVDCVLLETNDGKMHLDQAMLVFKAGKPVFIDKPAGAKLSEVVAIFRAADNYKVPMFSSSSLRYGTAVGSIRNGQIGDVLGASTHSPCSLEPSHSRLYWYGIHGVELLFTSLGSGCESVSMTTSEGTDLAVGHWSGGRIGTFRGIRIGKASYGGIAYGSKGIADLGKYDGYKPLVVEIAKFFRTGKAPIDPKETLNLYAFMAAAELSAQNGGEVVQIADVMKAAEQEADGLLSAIAK